MINTKEKIQFQAINLLKVDSSNKEDLEIYFQKLKLKKVSRDQEHLEEVFVYNESSNSKKPLIIVGGMGAVAGFSCFLQAIKANSEQKIILVQATQMPDRTSLILGKLNKNLDESRSFMFAYLDSIFDYLQKDLKFKTGTLVFACNTFHYFVDKINFRNYDFLSIVDATINKILGEKIQGNILNLYTEGTKTSGVYSQKMKENKIDFIEPSNYLQENLTKVIYENIKKSDYKSFDENVSLFLNWYLENQKEIGAILLGCTEIPILFSLLKEKGILFEDKVLLEPFEIAINKFLA
jgi:aspartate/glutamate racemase